MNHTTVQPAEYRLVARGNTLRVEELNGRTVAESRITWKRENHRFSSTKMDIDRDVLTKVDLGGTRNAVLLHSSHF